MTACSRQAASTADALTPAAFAADSAYAYVAAQCAFGARVPGSEAHGRCLSYLTEQLRARGAEVEVQEGTMPGYDGRDYPVRNVLAHFPGRGRKTHVLLSAHWDCRPWCDEEQDEALRQQAVLGANDGASGVGVLLEVARQLSLLREDTMPLPEVTIALWDTEDMGTPSFYEGEHRDDSWCLGSQLWAAGYSPTGDHSPLTYGILLDMVASPDAVFYKERVSMYYAKTYVERMWRTAERLGYGRYFRQEQGGAVTDDHLYVNRLAGIPCLDVIHYDPSYGFPAYWHTTHDDMSNVSPATLQAVGTTLMTTILQ